MGISSVVSVTAIALVLVAAAVAAALAVDAPLLAFPLVFLILVIWGGQRVASARDRA
jgi:hypothetical protein